MGNNVKLQVSTFYTLRNPTNSPDKIFKLKITTTSSNVISRSHHNAAQLQPLKQCQYKVSTSYTLRFLRYSPDKILYVKVTTARSKVKSRSHHDVAHLHPLKQFLLSINFLHLTVSEIQLGHSFSRSIALTPTRPSEQYPDNTLTALKVCGIKIGPSEPF